MLITFGAGRAYVVVEVLLRERVRSYPVFS
jgi:hypothetical protein